MIPLQQATDRVLGAVEVLEPQDVPLADALGAVLAQSITARESIPPFPNTAMDGFAVLAADTVGASADQPVRLSVTDTVAAGSVSTTELVSGTAQRIMTGAPMPPGADAVVMVELTQIDGDDVLVGAEVSVGNHIRPAGDDMVEGEVVFTPPTVLSPGHIGVLAALGYPTVKVVARPVVGVFSTGDELVVGDAPLGPGQIRDSNRPALLALCGQAGIPTIDLGVLPDDEDAIEAALAEATSRCDALLTSGGVSMGDFDFVKKVLVRRGDLNWMQVAIRPAKPLAFGLIDDTPIFGLPGNPVSSMVSFELFARPALRKMAGHSQLHRRRVRAIADETFARGRDGKLHLMRVNARPQPDGSWRIRSAGGQGSHQLRAMADGDALALCPDGDGLRPGDTVDVMLLD